MRYRLNYFDTIKFFAIIWIFFVHFISLFKPVWLRFWLQPPAYFILGGLTGKFATATLAVILGYFAFKKGTEQESLVSLCIKRYIAFFVMVFFANTIYLFATHTDQLINISTFINLFLTSLSIGDDIYLSFWCMQSFLFASVFSYINGKYNVSFFPLIIEILIFALTENTWIAICLMGNVLFKLIDKDTIHTRFQKIVSKPLTQILLILIVFIGIKREESEFTYFLYGIFSVFLITVTAYNHTLKRLLDNNVLGYLGKHSMGIYLLHGTIFAIIWKYIFPHITDSLSNICILFLISALITIPLSILLVKTINHTLQFLFKKLSKFNKKHL